MTHTSFTDAFQVALTAPEVLSALISGFFTFLAAAITSFTGWWVSRKFLSRKQAVKTCLHALEEIAEYHNFEAAMQSKTGESKVALRKYAFKENGTKFSGKFSPKALEQKISTYQRRVEESLGD
ncbi:MULTISPECIES: hypothetical protein [Vibrio]|uniref:hypothetical protein n=1 Tax=Vibrio TaxID=662 RepID=UPI0008413F12|nr:MULTISPECIES: hypothetical protein [Vibrio]ODM52322.1 hypothetical protein BC455_26725 [Vibrio harveyi]USD58563.1 hypothetical protein J4N44_26795 [Vibrio sp. SCSIO 43155]